MFPFCISFYNTRFGNWLNISDKRQLIEAIVDAQAKATDCPEYATYCHAYLDQNKFPPQVLDHWFFGCRLHDKDFNKEFIKEGIRMLKESMKNHSKMSTGGLELDWQKKFPALLAPAKEWNTTDEESNSADTEKEDVLQHFSMIKKEMSFSFHALTNQMAFDNQKRQRKGIFSLVPIAVQPINTRGVRLEWATKGKNWDGTKEYRAFEYITQHPATARVLNNARFESNTVVAFLSKRVRREKVTGPMAGKLSSATPSWELQTTGDNKISREAGVKVVGDHVSVVCDSKTIEDLFELLTVSPKCQICFLKFRIY